MKLDRLCENFAERRAQMNQLRKEDKHDADLVLREMHAKDVAAYSHAGTKFARVAGVETVRITTTKEDATSIMPSDAESPVEVSEDASETMEA